MRFLRDIADDAADAEAICEALARPNMPTVAIKNIDALAGQSLNTICSDTSNAVLSMIWAAADAQAV